MAKELQFDVDLHQQERRGAPSPRDEGRALVVGPNDIFLERQVLCGQLLLGTVAGRPHDRMCILPVDGRNRCRDHGERSVPDGG